MRLIDISYQFDLIEMDSLLLNHKEWVWGCLATHNNIPMSAQGSLAADMNSVVFLLVSFFPLKEIPQIFTTVVYIHARVNMVNTTAALTDLVQNL